MDDIVKMYFCKHSQHALSPHFLHEIGARRALVNVLQQIAQCEDCLEEFMFYYSNREKNI